MIRVIADTHVIIWFASGNPRLSTTARSLIEQTVSTGDQIGMSSVSLVEMVYLTEKQRIPSQILSVITTLLDTVNSGLVEVPFERKMLDALISVERSKVPDMPDRIIAATAIYLKLPLISRDGKIQASGVNTIW